MDEGAANRIVRESVRCGAAKILTAGGPLHPDPKVHHQHLITWARQAQNPGTAQKLRQHAWEEIVRGTSSLVFSLARSYFLKWRSHLPNHASFDDVFNAGMMGLTVAVNKFDVERSDVRLTTYATPWVRNHVQRACYAQCGSAHIPEHVLQAGIDPRSDLVASSTASLEAPSDFDGGETLGNLAVGRESPSDAMVEAQSLAELVALLRSIDAMMPQVADLLEQGCADAQIAKCTGLSVTRVQQLCGEARIVLKAHGYF